MMMTTRNAKTLSRGFFLFAAQKRRIVSIYVDMCVAVWRAKDDDEMRQADKKNMCGVER